MMSDPVILNDPRAVDYEAARAPVVKAIGGTESERYLAKLGERSFLNLWSYPNLFTDRGKTADGDGKELCDLLIVCGDHIIIFSDKTIAWPSGDEQVAWKRWYKRAILSSADQVKGATRWLTQFPDRIFLDRACTQPLPIALPPPERRKIHGVVVALGAGEACRQHFGEGIGSLMIIPEVQGDDHWKPDSVVPFCVGDVDPSGSFVHVFDDATLDIIMQELDTITDFTDYLNKKEAFVRSGKLLAAAGEDDLLAYYMIHMNAQGEHDFTKPDGSDNGEHDRVSITTGWHERMADDPRYVAKKQEDEISYLWDRLTEQFTTHLLAGTSLVPEGHDASIEHLEEGVRYLALVDRYRRRVYSEAISDVLRQGDPNRWFTRAMLPGPTEKDQDTGYFFMTLPVPMLQLDGGYEQYRQVRQSMLEAYALTFLQRHERLQRIVGIATEPPKAGGSSEDLIVIERPEWTPEMLASLEERRAAFGIVQEGQYREYPVQGFEFPEVVAPRQRSSRPAQGNRKQRRAAAAKAKKGKR